MTTREHWAITKMCWSANAKSKDKVRALRIVMHTPQLLPPRLKNPAPSGQDQVILNVDRRLSTPQLSS